MNFKKAKEEFDSLTGGGQWLWAIKNKKLITLMIDNDTTIFTFNAEDKSDDCTLVYFKSDIGDHSGIEFLMKHLGFSITFA